MNYAAADVKRLREETGATFADCKNALTEARSWDEAIKILIHHFSETGFHVATDVRQTEVGPAIKGLGATAGTAAGDHRDLHSFPTRRSSDLNSPRFLQPYRPRRKRWLSFLLNLNWLQKSNAWPWGPDLSRPTIDQAGGKRWPC